jgi:hypothetical protein
LSIRVSHEQMRRIMNVVVRMSNTTKGSKVLTQSKLDGAQTKHEIISDSN